MTPPIDAISLAVGAVALLIALAALGHAWLRRRVEGEPAASASALGLALGALAMAVATLIALAVARQPGAAAIAAALVPLAGLPALFPERARAWPGASAPIVTAALAAALGGALPLIADFQVDQPDPRLARVGLALLLLHVGLVGAIVPAHLWALGLAERVPPASLGVMVAFGDLAGLAALVAALASYPWLLGVVGTRALLTAVGAAGLALPLIGLAGESRPRRAVLLVGQLPAAAAWLTLASGAADGPAAAVALLLARALGLATALFAVDAIEREPALTWRTPHWRRLLGPSRIGLWIGLATLVGLPPTLGYAGGRAALAGLVAERPDIALTLLAAAGLTLLAARRVPIALLVGSAEAAGAERGASNGGVGDADGAEGRGSGPSAAIDAAGPRPHPGPSQVLSGLGALLPEGEGTRAEPPGQFAEPDAIVGAGPSVAGEEPGAAADVSGRRADAADVSGERAQAVDISGWPADPASPAGTDDESEGAGDPGDPDHLDADRSDSPGPEADGADAAQAAADPPVAANPDPGPAPGGPARPSAAPRPSEWRSAAAPLALAAVSLALGLGGEALLAALRLAAGRLGGG